MKDKELAKMIVDYIPFWELPHTEYKDNYKMILENIKEDPKSMYDCFYNEFEEDMTETEKLICNELTKRIKGEKQC